MAAQVIRFGPYIVTSQVFHTTRLTFCVVNLRPLLTGHILVCPLRSVQHISDLTLAEAADFFTTVQRMSVTLKRIYKTSSVNVGISDGVLAGQSVPHVHAHVIPRRFKDYDDDALYGKIGENDAEHIVELDKKQVQDFDTTAPRPPRSDEVMRKEAEWLRTEVDKDFPDMVESNTSTDTSK